MSIENNIMILSKSESHQKEKEISLEVLNFPYKKCALFVLSIYNTTTILFQALFSYKYSMNILLILSPHSAEYSSSFSYFSFFWFKRSQNHTKQRRNIQTHCHSHNETRQAELNRCDARIQVLVWVMKIQLQQVLESKGT